jgi:putative transposase
VAPSSPLKAIRLRVYPTKETRKVLRQWFGVARWTYNQCAAAINNSALDSSRAALRAAFVNRHAPLLQDKRWVTSVPYTVRDGALVDAVNARAAYNAKQAKNKNGFHLKFRSLHDPQQSIAVVKAQWARPNGVYSMVFSADALPCDKRYSHLLRDLPHDSRLMRDKHHHYFLCVPIERSSHPRPRRRDRMVAIDPGVRTFLTTYDQDGLVHEWGKGDHARLYRLAVHVDKLNQRASDRSITHRHRYGIKKAIGRIYTRIRNLVDDVHRKACKWLCEQYDTILLPAFNASSVVKQDSRRIHTKSVRSMLHWSHYRLRQRLLFKASEYPGVNVQVVTEEWTSKTCGRCSAVHHELGSRKRFVCPSCGWSCDRDVNGARNIMLKALSAHEQPSLRGAFGT